MRFTEHFHLKDFLRSARAESLGIDNSPTKQQIHNMRWHSVFVLEPIRIMLGVPVYITSGYRGYELNAATPGASKTSQHRFIRNNAATDITAQNISNKELFDRIRNNCEIIPYDQVILERDCVHISSLVSRQQALVQSKRPNGTFNYFVV